MLSRGLKGQNYFPNDTNMLFAFLNMSTFAKANGTKAVVRKTPNILE